MEKKLERTESAIQGDAPQQKRPFVAPKLTFVEPKLVKQGKMEHITGFFGILSP